MLVRCARDVQARRLFKIVDEIQAAGASQVDLAMYDPRPANAHAKVTRRAAPRVTAAMRARMPATVRVRCVVDEHGKPTDLSLEEGADAQFGAAAIAALKRWRFEPARKDGKPVPSRLRVPFRFAGGTNRTTAAAPAIEHLDPVPVKTDGKRTQIQRLLEAWHNKRREAGNDSEEARMILKLLRKVEAAKFGAVRGTVKDYAFDAGLSGAKITVEQTGDTVVSDEQGNFAIEKLPAGTYTLLFSKEGFGGVKKDGITVTHGKPAAIGVTMSAKYVDVEEHVVRGGR